MFFYEIVLYNVCILFSEILKTNSILAPIFQYLNNKCSYNVKEACKVLFSWAIRSSSVCLQYPWALRTSCKFWRCSCLVKHMYNKAAPSCARRGLSSALLLQSFPSDSGDRRCSGLVLMFRNRVRIQGEACIHRVHQRGTLLLLKPPFPSIYFHFRLYVTWK